MPSRLYVSSTDPIPEESSSAGWDNIAESVPLHLIALPDGSALTLGPQVGPWTAGQAARAFKAISDAMPAGIVFTAGVTTIKAQVGAREADIADNTTSRMQVRIVTGSRAGGNLLRATLLDVANYGPATELIPSGLRNKTFADGDAVAVSYTTQKGDRIEWSVGFSDAAGTTPEGTLQYGAPNGVADYGEDETNTENLRPWIEFSNNIPFGGDHAFFGRAWTRRPSPRLQQRMVG
jgi:hypothetical protein